MPKHQNAYETLQRARFMRPDAARWIRPDGARCFPPDVARFLKPGTDPAEVFPALDQKYSPNQRRVPAGQSGGGRWTDGTGSNGGGGIAAIGAGMPIAGADGEPGVDFSGDAVSVDTEPFDFGGGPSTLPIDATEWGISDVGDANEGADENAPIPVAWRGPRITDSTGASYYNPGGHHEMPRQIFDTWDLPPETRRIFNSATTGSLDGYIRTRPDGTPIGNFWNGPHMQYNDAVGELADRFLSENSITPSEMTPGNAMDLLQQIRESADPRIRDFNNILRTLRRLRMLRIGPRSE
jgi:hypothetical protein